jgi:hypothetical protein
VVRL